MYVPCLELPLFPPSSPGITLCPQTWLVQDKHVWGINPRSIIHISGRTLSSAATLFSYYFRNICLSRSKVASSGHSSVSGVSPGTTIDTSGTTSTTLTTTTTYTTTTTSITTTTTSTTTTTTTTSTTTTTTTTTTITTASTSTTSTSTTVPCPALPLFPPSSPESSVSLDQKWSYPPQGAAFPKRTPAEQCYQLQPVTATNTPHTGHTHTSYWQHFVPLHH
jgi:hypothetical protein